MAQMYSLFNCLLAQHSRELKPVRCAEQTIAQLHYFEDVVLENKLSRSWLRVPFVEDRQVRQVARAAELSRAASSSFFFISSEDALLSIGNDETKGQSCVLELPKDARLVGRFVVIADARFSALLASPPREAEDDDSSASEVIWTFDPDIVYSALEYLMARVTAEFPERAIEFSQAVGGSMPKATSLQLTVSVTTKLAQLLQSQAEREIAVNRIATAIRNSLELMSSSNGCRRSGPGAQCQFLCHQGPGRFIIRSDYQDFLSGRIWNRLIWNASLAMIRCSVFSPGGAVNRVLMETTHDDPVAPGQCAVESAWPADRIVAGALR